MNYPKETLIEAPLVFTKREMEILQLIAKEYSNKQLADSLCISVNTVESHRRNMMKKIGAKNFYGVIMYAFKNQLLK